MLAKRQRVKRNLSSWLVRLHYTLLFHLSRRAICGLVESESHLSLNCFRLISQLKKKCTHFTASFLLTSCIFYTSPDSNNRPTVHQLQFTWAELQSIAASLKDFHQLLLFLRFLIRRFFYLMDAGAWRSNKGEVRVFHDQLKAKSALSTVILFFFRQCSSSCGSEHANVSSNAPMSKPVGPRVVAPRWINHPITRNATPKCAQVKAQVSMLLSKQSTG